MNKATGTKTHAGTRTGAGSRQPDLGVMAREAVVSFLREASAATAQRQAARDDEAAVPTVAGPAATGAAALERVEALAGKVEADLATALAAQAELQAGAGAAAAAAIQAAQSSWNAAASAAESDRQAKISLRKVVRYVSITIVLLLITLFFIGLTAGAAH